MKVLRRNELMRIDGGYTQIPKWVKGGLWFAVACDIMNHWTDIKSGIADGWADAMKDK